MQRRQICGLAAALWAPRLWANHGWAPFDKAQPLYLEGPVAVILWSDPHPHLELLHRPDTRLPADLAQRRMPRQKERFDTAALLREARLPASSERRWRVELPSMPRLQAWGMERPKIDQVIGVVGLPGPPVTGTPTLRAEVLFIGDKAYPVLSDPA